MALSTSDLVADSLSVSSVGEGSGPRPALAPPLQGGRWSLAGVGWISNFRTRSPASIFSPIKIMSTQTLPRNVAIPSL